MRKLVVLTALALGTTAAQAADDLFYLGAGVTEGTLTASNNGYFAYGQPDLTKASWKAFVGVHPLSWLAIEAERIDFGSGNAGSFSNEYTDITHVSSSAWAIYAVGFVPVPWRTVDLFGKVGAARWKLNSTLNQYPNFPPPDTVISTPRSYSGTDFAWGLGVQAHINKMFGIRLEYEGFQVDGNVATVGALSVFLDF
jgi:opacity protein-like surface antigen